MYQTKWFIAFFTFLMYAIIVIVSFNDDKQVCTSHGYTSNSISPSLEGFCSKETTDGVTITVPVETVSIFNKRAEKQMKLAACVLSWKDLVNC